MGAGRYLLRSGRDAKAPARRSIAASPSSINLANWHSLTPVSVLGGQASREKRFGDESTEVRSESQLRRQGRYSAVPSSCRRLAWVMFCRKMSVLRGVGRDEEKKIKKRREEKSLIEA